MAPPKKPAIERFMAKVEKKENGCWEWTAFRLKTGYGKFSAGHYTEPPVLAHRWSYEYHKGPIPRGMCVCHSCDNPSCVNPDHLWVGTQKENMDDMAAKGRADRRPGSKHHKAKLTEEQVLAIRADGRGQTEIAKDYGVSKHTIHLIVKRKTWTHI